MYIEKKQVQSRLKRLEVLGDTFAAIYDATFENKSRTFFEYDEDGVSRSMSYSEVQVLIERAAYSIELLTDHVKDEFIALNFETSKEWVISFWAILMSGNKPFLVNQRTPLTMILKCVDTLKIKYSIDKEPNKFGAKSLMFDTLNKRCDDYKYEFADKIAISTSGTSLKQKICIYTGKEISNQLKNAGPIIKECKDIQYIYNKKGKLLAFLPFYHIYGLEAVYFWFSFFGYIIVFINDYSEKTLLDAIRNHGVTHLFAVPLFWESLAKGIRFEVAKRDAKTQEKFEKACKTSIKLLKSNNWLGRFFYKKAFKEIREKTLGESVLFSISGGSFIKESTLELINALGYNLHQGYGTTEIGITSVDLSSNAHQRSLGSIGKPVPTIDYKIAANGSLLVRGESVCNTIIIDGEETHNDEWFDTQDVVEKRGDAYYICGRITDLIINENGENLNPDDIEKAFNFKDSVVRFSVLGIENVPTIVIQIKNNLTKEEIISIKEDFEEQNLKLQPTFRVIKAYLTSDDIMAKTAIKVSREYLKKNIKEKKVRLYELNRLNTFEGVFIEDEISDKLLELFSESLSIEKDKIEYSSNFIYDLGGTSFDYLDLLSRINETFDVEIGTNEEISMLSINEFAEYIREAKKKWSTQ